MVALTDGDRRALTADVLRITKANRALASAALSEQWPFALIQAESPAWVGSRLWGTNKAVTGIRIALQRAPLASSEQGRGLAELARSNLENTVALATLARGSLEALARVEWVLSSASADELLVRHASLEFADFRYPEQQNVLVHHRGRDQKVPADTYRRAINEVLAPFGLKANKIGPTELATGLLDGLYHNGAWLYSGLSASAHGHEWATGNFFDMDTGALERDDQMIIEYCAYVIESTIHVSDRLIAALVPVQSGVDRWVSNRTAVQAQFGSILERRDRATIG